MGTLAGTDPIAAQAAEWIVRLSADDADARDELAQHFAAWRAADPRHEAAAGRIEAMLGELQAVRRSGAARPAGRALRAALGGKGRSGARRGVALALLLVGLSFLPVWFGLAGQEPGYWLTDLRSGAGEWPTTRLADGSTLALAGLSAVNLAFDGKTRRVELVQGEILVDVAHDPARPFVVETEHGSVRALGTRFTVRREAGATVVTMLASRVEVRPAEAVDGGALVVQAGERVRFNADRLLPPEPVDPPSIGRAWAQRQFVAQAMPLPDVLDELDRQRPGRIVFDRAALAGLKVTAVLPLSDTDRALQLLVNNFPELSIRSYSPYLVTVDLAKSAKTAGR